MTSTKDISTGMAKLIKATKKATLAFASMGITVKDAYKGIEELEKAIAVNRKGN